MDDLSDDCFYDWCGECPGCTCECHDDPWLDPEWDSNPWLWIDGGGVVRRGTQQPDGEGGDVSEIPDARLVLTYSRRMWHVSMPTTPYYTLCQAQSRRRDADPKVSNVCKRCAKAYEREMAS